MVSPPSAFLFPVCSTLPPSNAHLARAKVALRKWQRRTKTPADCMPNDHHIRRCPEAARLGLPNLFTRAGGYTVVARHLNLRPLPTLRRAGRLAELQRLADMLIELCEAHGLPQPSQSFPSNEEIRRLSPILANRLAAFPGRRGHEALRAHVLGLPPPRTTIRGSRNSVSESSISEHKRSSDIRQDISKSSQPQKLAQSSDGLRDVSSFTTNITNTSNQRSHSSSPNRKFRLLHNADTIQNSKEREPKTQMTNIYHLLELLRPFQHDPRLLPKLTSLPPALTGAIGRQGGIRIFATRLSLVREADYISVARYGAVASVLAALAGLPLSQLANELQELMTRETGAKELVERFGVTRADNSEESKQQNEQSSSKQENRISDKQPIEEERKVSTEYYISTCMTVANNPPRLPSCRAVRASGVSAEISRLGGRRCMATRLGYARDDCFPNVVLGLFSPAFAADVLAFALKELIPGVGGTLAIPSVGYMRDCGRFDLAAAVEAFGGEVVVGRRLGLVPTMEKNDEEASLDYPSHPSIIAD